MTKKVSNRPEMSATEMLQGMVRSHPRIVEALPRAPRLVVRVDANVKGAVFVHKAAAGKAASCPVRIRPTSSWAKARR